MKCPNCDNDAKPLVERPLNFDVAVSGSTEVSLGDMSGGATYTIPEVPTHEVFKCCNEKCWVTKIEVDWG